MQNCGCGRSPASNTDKPHQLKGRQCRKRGHQKKPLISKIIERTLRAVVRAGAVDDAAGGTIDFLLALEGLCGVIGMLAVQSGNVPTPRDMRLLSEDAGKAILLAMKGTAAKESAGDGIDWKLEPIGKPN